MSRLLLRAGLVASVFFLTACDDTVRASYPTAEAARADGAIRRGLLPASLPDSAFEIASSHDVDTNTGGGSFRFAARDADSFRARLHPLSAAQLQSLAGGHARLQRDGWTFYTAPGFWLAVNWQTCHVQFWLDDKSE